MKLMFHVHAVHLTFGVNERKLAKRLDVAVKMEPSTKPHSFLLQIVSYEKNAGRRQRPLPFIIHFVTLLSIKETSTNSGDRSYGFLVPVDYLL